MKIVLVVTTAVIVLLSGASLPEAKEKKATKAAPAKKEEPAAARASAAPSGWREIQSSAPNLLKVAYKFDGHYINIKFQNLTTDRMVRVKYQAKWKKDVGGKWVDDASPEGVTVRLRKQEEIIRDVVTRSPDIRDVVIDIEASEVL